MVGVSFLVAISQAEACSYRIKTSLSVQFLTKADFFTEVSAYLWSKMLHRVDFGLYLITINLPKFFSPLKDVVAL